MWVKICGNTNLKDASLAAELGADAVGFVFAKSKRQVSSAQVAAITPHLSHRVEMVGVFDSHDPEEIAAEARTAGLTTVQLHGGFDEDLLRQLSEKLAGTIGIIQTLHWAVGNDSGAESAALLKEQIKRADTSGIANRILVDSKVGQASGGTGVAFEWGRARATFASAPSSIHLVLAGGLTPDNIVQAIGELNPWGVDVCSGVEAAPGEKDPERLARFIKNARAAAQP